jgi:UDP-N-acetylmuramate--alanine ligase
LQLVATLKERGIPMKKRSEVLETLTHNHETIAIAGAHGKTTTTALLSHIFYQSNVGCTAFVGGVVNGYESNYFSKGIGPFIVEADEFDRSLLHLNPHIAIINSMDVDHLDIYGCAETLRETYNLFANRIDKDGFLVVKKGLENSIDVAVKLFTFSIDDDSADFYATNIHVVEGLYHFDLHTPTEMLNDIVFGGSGRINISNAVGAATVALQYGIDKKYVIQSLATFSGVQRRFQFHIRTNKLVLIDDYAHHPEEIRATLQSVRSLYPDKKILAVFQPHLYSRTRDFADGFAETLNCADEVLLLDIYPAREQPIEGVSSMSISQKMPVGKVKLVKYQQLPSAVAESNPQVVVMLGAGDIDRLVLPVKQSMLNLKEHNI